MNDSIDAKLEAIDQKLSVLTEQMAIQARRQREMQELKDDLNRIATDMFQSTVVELDEVSASFDIADLLYLLKRLLRNVKNMSKMLEQVESLNDLSRDLVPIGNQAYLNVLAKLDELDRKGYFEFFAESLKIIDNVVTSFTPEDVRLLSENIVQILNTVKNLTQPDVLVALNNAVSVYKSLEIDIQKEVSYWDLWRESRKPEMRRGVAFAIQFLKNLVAANSKNSQS